MGINFLRDLNRILKFCLAPFAKVRTIKYPSELTQKGISLNRNNYFIPCTPGSPVLPHG